VVAAAADVIPIKAEAGKEVYKVEEELIEKILVFVAKDNETKTIIIINGNVIRLNMLQY
jgi:hypothetical protein